MLSIIHAEVWYERDQGIFIHSGGVLPLGRVGAAGQSVLRRGADPRRVPVRAFMGDPGKREKSRPTRAFRNSAAIPAGQAPDRLPATFESAAKKEVNAMTCDESLYRQYLNGDDEGLNALMKKNTANR